ncbi:hypothetical protein [Streptomyces sp. NPDC047718]|uniref:hypothetical protein n=1 Tax=Streptomyces sp. NPDC047718 TaxID=3155479 RepID=UPI0033E489F4
MHVNVPHDTHFVVVGNHLAQHRELSLAARGLALYIQSLPQGAPINIKALAWQLEEGEYRIAKALRELEEHGYLARVRERLPSGQIVTRTISYNRPQTTARHASTTPARAKTARRPRPSPGTAPAPGTTAKPDAAPQPGANPDPNTSPAPADGGDEPRQRRAAPEDAGDATADLEPDPKPKGEGKPLPAQGTTAAPPAPCFSDGPVPEHVPPGHPAGKPPDTSPPRAERDPANPDPEPDPDACRVSCSAVASLSELVPSELVPSDLTDLTDLTPTARHILSTLRAVDARLMLSERDVVRLTPAVSVWLERGVLPFAITFALSDDLPPDLRHPAGLVAYRLRELLPAPTPAPASPSGPPPPPNLPGDRPRTHPLQVCVRCDSISFRAAEPGLCNPCKREEKDAA